MIYLRKYLTITIAVASAFLAIGCSAGEITYEDLGISKPEASQPKQAQPAQPAPQPQTETTVQAQLPPAWININARQALQLIESDKTLQIVDLRDSFQYRNKHIRGAIFIPITHIKEGLGEIDKSKPILLYDDTGRSSKSAAKFLTNNGCTKVYVLVGGISSGSFPVEP